MDPRQRNVTFDYKVRRKLDYGTDPQSPSSLDKEFKRRLLEESPATATTVQQAAAPASVPISAPPKQFVPPAVIDRWHKESGSLYGGYVMVARDHDSSETDQIPPLNPGYLYQSKASSVADAYAKAVVMSKLIKGFPNARVAVIIVGGSWIEHFTVDTQGIDFIGIGLPMIGGCIAVQSAAPKPTMPYANLDTRFEGIAFRSYASDEKSGPNLQGGLWLMPGTPDATPAWPLIRLKDCEFYSDAVAMFAQQRFYAEGCKWFSTDTTPLADENRAPLQIQILGLEAGATILERCTIRSWLQNPSSDAAGPTDYIPGGYAWRVLGPNFGQRGFLDTNAPSITFEQVSARVVANDCNIYGSLMVRGGGDVSHKHGSQHGAVALGPASSGSAYAFLMGTPLFNNTNGYIGDAPAIARFSHTDTYAETIATSVAFDGTYPSGVTPATYPGTCYVAYIHSAHYVRLTGGSPWAVIGGNGRADVVNSSTGASTWTGLLITSNSIGSNPVNVTALQYDPYLI
ncbi:hypothetical protein KGP36_01600 [Patescibacteria group bacterium]|nr:hypothetical protein [Patescibacteria group bacterium]